MICICAGAFPRRARTPYTHTLIYIFFVCVLTGHPGGLIQDIWMCASRSEVVAHRSQRGRIGTGSITPQLQPSVVQKPNQLTHPEVFSSTEMIEQ